MSADVFGFRDVLARNRKSAGGLRKTFPASVDDDRTPIDLEPSRLSEAVLTAATALGRHPRVYQRGTRLVHVVTSPDPGAYAAPVVQPINVALLKSYLSTVVAFRRFDKRAGDMVPANVNEDVACAVHASSDWPKVRPLVGILEAPSIRLDGTVIQDPGYDASTGYLYQPSIDFPKVPTEPTQDDATRALEQLCEVFADFPWANEASRMVPIAALLSLIARPAIAGSVPIFVKDKSTRGVGGTLSIDAISTINRGRPAPKMSYPPNPEELEKILASYAISGAPIVPFDNVAVPFGGGALDRCVTAGREVELRTLGKSEIQTLRWIAVVFASGNNICLQGDTGRRSLVGRLECSLENPEDRQGFKHPDLLAWVQENRARLVVAALTLLRAWWVAGKPKAAGERSWGSFEAWAAIVPHAIAFAGGANVLDARAEVSNTEDPDRQALTVILDQWQRLDEGGRGLKISTALKALYPDDRGPRAPDSFDDLRDALDQVTGGKVTTTKVAYALRKFKGRVIAGKRLVALPAGKGMSAWSVQSAGGQL